jgi:eukaryotic-like serine/threonine-protein kinase
VSGVLHKSGDLVGGRYKVRSYIGQGGMQEVYRARDTLLERAVALKSPKGPSAEKRFKRSAVVSARVKHANVAKTLDYFEDGTRPYLIEELVVGCNLSEFRRQHVPALDPYSVARILHHLAKGVQASHHANVIHRDLKPSNVMVVGGATFNDVKITDFGIAKLAEEEIGAAVGGGGEALTASATALGALPYMAPEMIDDPKNVGKAADIWALGAITFELLTGDKPFGDGYKAVPRIQAASVPPLPHTIAKNTQFSALAGEIYALVLESMKLDTGDRLDADGLVERCGSLCYSNAQRHYGTITSLEHNAYGFISPDGSGGSVFYHMNSTYNLPSVKVGTRVWYSKYPGNPRPRAFPVVAATDPSPS